MKASSNRFLILLPQFHPGYCGGGQQIFHSLLEHQGVKLLAGQLLGDEPPPRNVSEIPGGFRTVRRRRRQRSVYHFDFYWGSPKLITRALRETPDVVITREFSYLTAYAVFIRIVSSSRVVVMVESDRGRLGTAGSGLPTGKLKLNLLRLLSRFVDRFIAHDRDAEAFLIRDLRVSESRISVQPWIVLASTFVSAIRTTPGQPGAGPISHTLLMVGQLTQRKGVDLAVQALWHLRENSDIELWVVGAGSERDSLEQLADRLGVRPFVRFLGRREAADIAGLLSQASLFLFPTRGDYTGVAAFEAMAAGTPVVSSDRTNLVPTYIEDGASGFVFNLHEGAVGLARTLEQALSDPERLARVVAEAKRRVDPLTDSSHATRAIIGILKDVASRSG